MKIEKESLSFYPAHTLEYQLARYKRAVSDYRAEFGKDPKYAFSTPGRSEICGNHTDHNLGKAVGAAIDLDIIALVSPRDDNRIIIRSNGFSDIDIDVSRLDINPAETGKSPSLVRGVCRRLSDMGCKIGGFDAYTQNDLPRGGGLSSSAAFGVQIAFIISRLFGNGRIGASEQADAAHYAENIYFGKGSGLLDQLCCAFGGAISIDFENKAKPKIERLPFDLSKSGCTMIITDTHSSHSDLSGDYDAIKADMQAVSAAFGKNYLRQVSYAEFYESLPRLKNELSERAIVRAFHYFDENDNVAALSRSLKDGDFEKFFGIVNRSGGSSFRYLQNIYSDKTPESQGVTLALCLSEHILAGRGAVRVHGGGFGGTIQAYVPNDATAAYIEKMESVFGAGSCHKLTIRNQGPVRVI